MMRILLGFIVLALALVLFFSVRSRSLHRHMQRWAEQRNVKMLATILSHKDERTRITAISMLARTSHIDAVNHLLALLRDDDVKVQIHAIDGIAYLGSCGVLDATAVDELVDILQVQDYPLRENVAAALGATGLSAAIPALVSALRDADDKVVLSSVRALGQLARQRAFHPRHDIREEHVVVISNALEVLQSLTTNKSLASVVAGSLDYCAPRYAARDEMEAGTLTRSDVDVEPE